MSSLGLSIRTAAPQVGCSAATLGRLLRGTKSDNVPDTVNVSRAVQWLGASIGDFERPRTEEHSSLTEVQVHLRGLKGLSNETADAIFAMVKAAYETATTEDDTGPKKR